MPTIIKEISYLSITELAEIVGVTRQTLWRWRQDGKIPAGHLFRNKQVLFSPEEVEVIDKYANRIEPLDGSPDEQLNLFNGNQRTKWGS